MTRSPLRSLDADIALAYRLADAARGAILPFYRSDDLGDEDKGDASPVTRADRAAEAAMRAILDAERGDDGIIGEEYGVAREGASRQWVLDPIDGTVSFMAGRPIFTTLIALMVDGFPVLGLIDQPVLGERWLGASGQATTLNGRNVRTRTCRELSSAMLATTSPHLFSAHEGEHFLSLAGKVATPRIVYGGDAYNYALLSMGQLDMVVEAGLKLHDLAALTPGGGGAGGLMCDWAGEPLHAASAGDVIALGDPARLEDVLEALACHHH